MSAFDDAVREHDDAISEALASVTYLDSQKLPFEVRDRVQVFCDGQLVRYCVRADREHGWVEAVRTFRDNATGLSLVTGDHKAHRRRGRVEFVDKLTGRVYRDDRSIVPPQAGSRRLW